MKIAINGLSMAGQPTGIGVYTENLLEAMATAATVHDCLVIHHAAIDFEDACPPAARERARSVPVEAGTREWEETELPAILLEEGADVYLSPLPALPAIVPCASVVAVHDMIPFTNPELGSEEVRDWLRRRIEEDVPRADRVLVVSADTRDRLLTHLAGRLDPARVVLTYESPGLSFHPRGQRERDEARRRYQLPERYLLYVGTIEPRKNVEGLLVALARIAGQGGTPPEVVLVGREDRVPYPLARRLQDLGISHLVNWLGYVDAADLPAIYSGAEALVLPSFAEGFGLPAAEAIACGTPIVASTRGGLPEVVGEAGILVDPSDVEGLAAAMRVLWNDPGRRTELARRASAQAARFSPSRWGQRIEELFLDLLHDLPRSSS